MSPPNKFKTYPASEGVCTKSEIQAMLATLKSNPTGIRDAAIIMCLYRSGLRCSELLGLERSALSRTSNMIKVLHGKGDKARIVALDNTAIKYIDKWLAVKPKSEILFCNLKGRKMDTSYVRKMIKRMADKAGIKHRVHAHGLRHTHAYELVSEGVPVHFIKDQLGHSNIATTDRYLNHLNPKERVDRIAARDQ